MRPCGFFLPAIQDSCNNHIEISFGPGRASPGSSTGLRFKFVLLNIVSDEAFRVLPLFLHGGQTGYRLPYSSSMFCPGPAHRDACPQPVLRTGEPFMEMKRTASRPGTFAYLLKGGARPRRSPVFLIALVLVALLSFAGVVPEDGC